MGMKLDECTCRNWFARFKAEDFDLNYRERGGGPVLADDALLEETRQRSTSIVKRAFIRVDRVAYHRFESIACFGKGPKGRQVGPTSIL